MICARRPKVPCQIFPRPSNPIDVPPRPHHRPRLSRENGRERLTFGQRHTEQRRQQHIRSRGGSGGSVTAVAYLPNALSHVPILPLSVEVCGLGDRFAIGHTKAARCRMPSRIARSRKGAKQRRSGSNSVYMTWCSASTDFVITPPRPNFASRFRFRPQKWVLPYWFIDISEKYTHMPCFSVSMGASLPRTFPPNE